MFTGIIESVGAVTQLQRTPGKLTLAVQTELQVHAIGDSVAIDGICLTVTKAESGLLWFDAAEETLRLTAMGEWKVGERIQLERAMRADGRFDGHIVQGHVDGTALVSLKRKDGDATWMEFTLAPELSRYTVKKGSIAINGMSLTLTAASDNTIAVMLIPHTLAKTELGNKQPGAKVNIEVDILAKYVERMLQHRSGAK